MEQRPSCVSLLSAFVNLSSHNGPEERMPHTRCSAVARAGKLKLYRFFAWLFPVIYIAHSIDAVHWTVSTRPRNCTDGQFQFILSLHWGKVKRTKFSFDAVQFLTTASCLPVEFMSNCVSTLSFKLHQSLYLRTLRAHTDCRRLLVSNGWTQTQMGDQFFYN